MGRDRGPAAAQGTKGEATEQQGPRAQGSGRVEGAIYGRAFKLFALACATLLSGIADSGSFGGQHGPGVQRCVGGSVGRQAADLGGGADGRSLGPSARKSGQRKRCKNLAKDGLKKVRGEHDVYEAKRSESRFPRRRRSRVDVVEIFAGSSMLTLRCGAWGLKALQPIDILFGHDLRRRAQRRWCRKLLARVRPRLAVIGFPCTKWS